MLTEYFIIFLCKFESHVILLFRMVEKLTVWLCLIQDGYLHTGHFNIVFRLLHLIKTCFFRIVSCDFKIYRSANESKPLLIRLIQNLSRMRQYSRIHLFVIPNNKIT